MNTPSLLHRTVLLCALTVPSFGQAPAAATSTANTEVIQLSPFELRAERESSGYRTSSVLSAALIEMPREVVPSLINVVTADILDEKNIYSLENLFTATAGVTQFATGDYNQQFRIRGFSAPSLRNGFSNALQSSMAGVERVEISKGPNSVLFGSNAFGGAINRVTRKPQFTAAHSARFTVGSYDYHGVRVDSTGPVPVFGNDVLAYRLIYDRFQHKSEIDFRELQMASIIPSLRFRPWMNLIFNAEYEHYSSNEVPVNDVPETAGSRFNPALGPQYDKEVGGFGHTFSIQGPDAFRDGVFRTLTTDVTMLFNDIFSANVAYMYTSAKQEEFRMRDFEGWSQDLRGERGAANQAAPRGRIQYRDRYEWSDDVRAQLVADVPMGNVGRLTGVLAHTFFKSGYNSATKQLANFVVRPGFRMPNEVLQEVRGLPRPGNANDDHADGNSQRLSLIGRFFDDRLNFIGGYQQQEGENTNAAGSTVSFDGDNHQFGVTYAVTKPFILFANYGTDFTPTNVIGANGQFLTDPQTGSGYDVGVKLNLLDGAWFTTIAYFDQERSNIPNRITVVDPVTNLQSTYFILSGRIRHKGLEFESVWDVRSNWQVIISGSFFDAKTLENRQVPDEVGQPPEDTIENSLSWQTRYGFNGGMLDGWIAGTGGYWHDDARAEGNVGKLNVRYDDHYILNVFVHRDFTWRDTRGRFSLYVDNILNKRGYVKRQEYFGEPLWVRATLGFQF